MRPWRLLALLIVSQGCDRCGLPAPPAGSVDLIHHGAWRLLDAAEDPFTDRPSDDPACKVPEGWTVRNDGLEIDTDDCDYASIGQPILAAIAAGDELELAMWHSELRALDAGTAHMAVAIGAEVICERTIAIPADPELFIEPVRVATAAPAGTTVVFHAHNHGPNTYVMSRVVRLPAAPPP